MDVSPLATYLLYLFLWNPALKTLLIDGTSLGA